MSDYNHKSNKKKVKETVFNMESKFTSLQHKKSYLIFAKIQFSWNLLKRTTDKKNKIFFICWWEKVNLRRFTSYHTTRLSIALLGYFWKEASNSGNEYWVSFFVSNLRACLGFHLVIIGVFKKIKFQLWGQRINKKILLIMMFLELSFFIYQLSFWGKQPLLFPSAWANSHSIIKPSVEDLLL